MHSLELEQNFLKIDVLASSIKSPINELRIHQYILIGGGQKISRDESLDLLRKSYQIKDVCYTLLNCLDMRVITLCFGQSKPGWIVY